MDINTIKALCNMSKLKNKRQNLGLFEYNFWLFQYSARKFKIEIIHGDEFNEKNGRVINKSNMKNWKRLKETILGTDYCNDDIASKNFYNWMKVGYTGNNPHKYDDPMKSIRLNTKYLVNAYGAYHSFMNDLYYLPPTKIELSLIERFISLPTDIQANAQFLADLSHTYGDYFYHYANWFPMELLLRMFANNSLSFLKTRRDTLLAKTGGKSELLAKIGDKNNEETLISDLSSFYQLDDIDKMILRLERTVNERKNKEHSSNSFYKDKLSIFLEQGNLWSPFIEPSNLGLTAQKFFTPEISSIEDLYLLALVASENLQFRNDSLSADGENISQNLLVDRLRFPRGYRTNDELDALKANYDYDDLLVCLWIKSERDDFFVGEKLAKKICNIINRELKNKSQKVDHEERIMLEEPDRCLVAKNISDWKICTNANLVFIVKINAEKYNKSFTDTSIKAICKVYYAWYFNDSLPRQEAAEILPLMYGHAHKSFKEFQIGRFLGLWAWDQIELNRECYSSTVERAVEIAKTVFGLWLDSHADSDGTNQERHMKTYLEKTRLCVKAGAVLPLA